MIGSCAKEESAPPPLSLEEQLMKNSWQLQKVQIQIPPDQGLTDIPNLGLEACESDDSFRFFAGNVFVLDDGINKCGGSGRSIFRSVDGGRWKLTPLDSGLVISADIIEQKFKIKSISGTSLIIYQSTIDLFGQETWYLFNLTAKK